jgi:hypothetical protein
VKKALLAAIRFYRRHLSPHLPPMCRYYPTCSVYAIEAIETHGALRGSLLAVWRLLRCNPLSPGGYDPVPPKREKRR